MSMKGRGITTLSISKPTKLRLIELTDLSEQRFVNWDLALNDLIDYVIKAEGIELKTPNPVLND